MGKGNDNLIIKFSCVHSRLGVMPFDKENLLEDEYRKSAKEIIIEMILLLNKVTLNQIHQSTGISLSMIQRDLKSLCRERIIKKIGKAPRVQYELCISNYVQSTVNT